jgi:hypothetical protein
MFANTHPSIAVELFLDDGKGGRSQGTIGPSGQLQVKLLLTNALQEDKHLTLTLSHITMPPHIHCTDQGTYWRSAFRRPCRRHWRAEDKISGAYRPPTRAWGVLFGEGGAAAVVANCGAQAGHTSPARRRNHMRACRRVAGVGAGRSRPPPHRIPHRPSWDAPPTAAQPVRDDGILAVDLKTVITKHAAQQEQAEGECRRQWAAGESVAVLL